ncbi:hypothetical protein PK28_12790 [Hymenobacter sp. DG25B]|uniref:DUF2256 domain-containing protein n=1 Tax=Hymenobacter sp. DG25B TaxID=1385664 RepID=UPI00054076EA|nr:hypothetical protein PK28_12790 [Hymenobacter sp. DG25B]
MPKARSKSDLPTKICVTCGRPFAWRKKWQASWEAVKYCGEKCQRNRLKPPADSAGSGLPKRQ